MEKLKKRAERFGESVSSAVVQVCWNVLIVCAVEPPNKGHFGNDINPADLFFVERFSSLGGSKSIVGVTLGL